jgi:hypothetical protein
MAAINHRPEQAVSKLAQSCDVTAAAARGEPCSLCEIRAAQKCMNELRDLARIRRAVRVDHGNDLAGRSFEAAGKRVPLASASLLHYPHVGPSFAGYRDGVVHRVPVHHDYLVDVCREP